MPWSAALTRPKVIQKLFHRPHRKATFLKLGCTRCSVAEQSSGYTPSDESIWRSVRSTNLQRLTREFFWKCIQNTSRVGDFWNGSLGRDRILTDRLRLGPLALNQNLVLTTGSDLLMDEDSLLNNWLNEEVLVGIWSIVDRHRMR
jgi:hypothetical protein